MTNIYEIETVKDDDGEPCFKLIEHGKDNEERYILFTKDNIAFLLNPLNKLSEKIDIEYISEDGNKPIELKLERLSAKVATNECSHNALFYINDGDSRVSFFGNEIHDLKDLVEMIHGALNVIKKYDDCGHGKKDD